jgi:hypothetical protein
MQERGTAAGSRTPRQRLVHLADTQADVPLVSTDQLKDDVDGGMSIGQHALRLIAGRPLELAQQTGTPWPPVERVQQTGHQILGCPAGPLIHRQNEDHHSPPPSQRMIKATVLFAKNEGKKLKLINDHEE